MNLSKIQLNLARSQSVIEDAKAFLQSRQNSNLYRDRSLCNGETVNEANPSRLSPNHPHGIKKIQIGCGPKNILPDWWNVDIRPFPGLDRVMDVTKPWDYSGVRYIYGEHFLEHLSLEGAVNFLCNAWQSLDSRGLLRLSTPSLEWVLSTHMNLSETNLENRIASTFAINRAFHGWGHQFLYSQDFLTDLLVNLGWTKIQYCDYGESQHKALKGLERHGKYRINNGYPSVWIVEASKTPVFPQISSYVENLEKQYINYANAGH